MNRYLDIDSSFRNRVTYPSIGNFVIPVNNSVPRTSLNAYDPVLLSFPYDGGQTRLASIGPITDPASGTVYTAIPISTTSRLVFDFYVNSYIYIGGVNRQIVGYTIQATTLFGTAVPIQSILILGNIGIGANVNYFIRFELPQVLNGGVYEGNTVALSANLLNITLDGAASNVDNFYVGKYIFIPPNVDYRYPWATTNINFAYQYALIINYVGATKVATLATPLLVGSGGGLIYQILNFSYDNSKSFQYIGTEIFNNPQNVKMKLTNLIIPAYFPVSASLNGLITDYPYIYVCLYSEREHSYNQPLISNNPYSNKALFRCSIQQKQETLYINLQSNEDDIPIYFNPHDDLHFQILLPNGEILKFKDLEYIQLTEKLTFFPGLHFPIPPDNENQIQATIKITY
jgi:hypothetical protein